MKAVDRKVLDALLALEEGWDSYGAPPIHPQALLVAANLSVVPTSSGGLQFEWHTPCWDLEIEISPEGALVDFAMSALEPAPKETVMPHE